MANTVKVLGVHPVDADEPVHLIEIELDGDVDEFIFAEVTQEVPDQPQENWQVAWDEQELKSSTGKHRFAFFFHYLDLDRPLLTSFGPTQLPAESKVPKHLRDIKYEEP